MANMAIRMGRAPVGGEGGQRWDVPLRAVDNEDGTYSLCVSQDEASAQNGAQVIALLTDIKAEMVKLNASVNTEVDLF